MSRTTGTLNRLFRLIYRVREQALAINLDEMLILGLGAAVFCGFAPTAAFVLLLVGRLFWKKAFWQLIRQTPGAAFLIAMPLIAAVWSALLGRAQGVLTSLFMLGLFLAILVVRAFLTGGLFERLADVLGGASFVAFGAAAVQSLQPDPGPLYRIPSTFLNANFYAAAATLMVLLGVWRLDRMKGSSGWIAGSTVGRRGFYILTIMVNLGGLSLSNSRTAAIGLALAVPLFLALRRRDQVLRRVLGAEAALGLLMLVVPLTSNRLDTAVQDLGLRIGIWGTALRGFLERPLFGWGGGAYPEAAALLGGPQALHAHNLVLELLLNFGLLGTALLTLFLVETLRQVRQLVDRGVFALATALLVCLGAQSLTDASLLGAQVLLLTGMLLGIVGISTQASGAPPLWDSEPAWLWLGTVRERLLPGVAHVKDGTRIAPPALARPKSKSQI